MIKPKFSILDDRGVLRLGGPATRDFIQGLITTDVGRLDRDGALYAGLLTPQGKIMFDFLMARDGDTVLIDCARDRAADLAKRLLFYRLRAAVEIADLSDTFGVAAVWNDEGGPVEAPEGILAYRDPRLAAMGVRLIGDRAGLRNLAMQGAYDPVEPSLYDRHRMRHGLADSAEIGSGELFPHECNFDQFGGVDFSKGCYVGQEVVSRTEHRGSARKRIVPISVDGGTASAGTTVTAGDKQIGTVLSAADGIGLALIRLDRAGTAIDEGMELRAGNATLRLGKPSWARFAVPGT